MSNATTKSRRDLLTLGAAAAAGAALSAVPVAVKGVVSGNETSADPILALWAKRNALNEKASRIRDSIRETEDREVQRQKEREAEEVDSEAHDIEADISDLEPTSFDGLGIQAVLLALSVLIGKRGDGSDVVIAERLFQRFAPQDSSISNTRSGATHGGRRIIRSRTCPIPTTRSWRFGTSATPW